MPHLLCRLVASSKSGGSSIPSPLVSVYSSNGTWIYVTRMAEYYYYTTALVKPFTGKNVDLVGFGGGSSDQSYPDYGPFMTSF